MKQPHKDIKKCSSCKAYLFTDGYDAWCENLNCPTNKQEENTNMVEEHKY